MRRVGIRDVAERAGVSISTVSNALNKPGAVSDDLATKIRLAVQELGYIPLQAARQLRAGRSGLLGMTVINIVNPYYAALMTGAEESAAASGLHVLVGSSDDDAAKESAHLELFERVQVEGALIAPFGDTTGAVARLRARRIPVVLLDSVDDAGEMSSVSFDHAAGGRIATEHLVDLGRRRLAFLGAREEVRQVRERLLGARQAAARHPDVQLDVLWTDRTTPELGRDWGARFAALPAHQRPDGVVTTNDLLACGLVSALVEAGVRVPDDIAVVGYDDIEFASVAAVPLTSVRQPARGMGRAAGAMLLRHIAGKREREAEVFPPELVVRESTAGRQMARLSVP